MELLEVDDEIMVNLALVTWIDHGQQYSTGFHYMKFWYAKDLACVKTFQCKESYKKYIDNFKSYFGCYDLNKQLAMGSTPPNNY